ncbi:MAG: hypothetical protein JRN28_00205 [Nitrososphaerota archaeon]|nr:hypothetical protein [Nitrososphaerota archaeon]
MSSPPDEYVDIYYDGTMVFRRVLRGEVDKVIQGWMSDRKAQDRPYDQSKFSTQPTKYQTDIPPIASMTQEQWKWEKEKAKRERLDFRPALRHGFFVQEAGKLRLAFGFTKILDTRCKVHRNMQDEELIYGIMTSIHEFSPGLPEPEFLAMRRVVWRYALTALEKWKNTPSGEPKAPQVEIEKKVEEAKSKWVSGLKDAKTRDMLTLIYDMQLDNARKVIGEGANFQPELLMWKGRELAVNLIQGPDPMTQAIAIINQARPEGYSFAAETWRSPMGGQFRYEKWGDIAKLEGKTEGFHQVCAENFGPFLTRQFKIDRTDKLLVLEGRGGRSRMPLIWELEASRVPSDTNAGGAYA